VNDAGRSDDGSDRRRLLCVVAILRYGVGDTITTIWGVSSGRAVEAGLVAAPMTAASGPDGLVGIKLGVVASFYLA
jgi:hypothetical protein